MTSNRVFPKPRIVISKCIGFDACRYNGEMVQDSFVQRLKPHVEFVTICPEMEIGLGVPRAPIRIIAAASAASPGSSASASARKFKLIQPSSGLDLTREMEAFNSNFLNSVGGVDGFILKNRSPSCGIADVKFYAGPEKGPTLGRTAGFFGGAVTEAFDGSAIEDEGRLKNLAIREHFLTRIFAFARFRAVAKNASFRGLVQFHAAHKLQLMAYNQTRMRALGRVVANDSKRPPRELAATYGEEFRRALRAMPRAASPVNVMMHALGYFKKGLTGAEKEHFLGLLEAYRRGRAPLSSVVSILRSWIARFDTEYLNDQTFFTPFPESLMALDNSARSRE